MPQLLPGQKQTTCTALIPLYDLYVPERVAPRRPTNTRIVNVVRPTCAKLYGVFERFGIIKRGFSRKFKRGLLRDRERSSCQVDAT